MNSKTFHFSLSFKPLSVLDSFSGTSNEKKLLKEILNEWNARMSLSDMCRNWKKERPLQQHHNLLFLVYNVEGLNTHLTDMDILINAYHPDICILSGVGAAVKKPPTFPGYLSYSQVGSNSFGGVMIYYKSTLKCQVIDRDINFLVVKTYIAGTELNIGGIYVPPTTTPPLHLFDKYTDKHFVICGDFNAKHSHWKCPKNNVSGNVFFNWLELSVVEVIFPGQATSRKSKNIIDFGITNDANGWQAEVVNPLPY